METKTESFKVAGISHYKDDIIKNFVSEVDNDEFDYASTDVELIPETENEHDPNAIKVLVDGIMIGHVPKELTSFVRDILNSPNYSRAEVTIFCERDPDDDESDNMNLWASVHLSSQCESDEEKKSKKNYIILAKIELTLGILLFFLSLIITKVAIIFFALLIITHSLYYIYMRRNQ